MLDIHFERPKSNWYSVFLAAQGHEVDSYGIGTYLVTCYAQAALGCVFKLVEINNQPRIKLSEDVSKVWSKSKKLLLVFIESLIFLPFVILPGFYTMQKAVL